MKKLILILFISFWGTSGLLAQTFISTTKVFERTYNKGTNKITERDVTNPGRESRATFELSKDHKTLYIHTGKTESNNQTAIMTSFVKSKDSMKITAILIAEGNRVEMLLEIPKHILRFSSINNKGITEIKEYTVEKVWGDGY